MSREKFIEIVLDSINSDNRMMAEGLGMSKEEVEKNIEQSQQGLQYMLSNAYDKLKQKDLVK